MKLIDQFYTPEPVDPTLRKSAPTFRTFHSAHFRISFAPTNPGHFWPEGDSLAAASTTRDCYRQNVFSAERPRIVVIAPHIPRTRPSSHLYCRLLRTLMLWALVHAVAISKKCQIGVRNVGPLADFGIIFGDSATALTVCLAKSRATWEVMRAGACLESPTHG